jgi:hypothetical protein
LILVVFDIYKSSTKSTLIPSIDDKPFKLREIHSFTV